MGYFTNTVMLILAGLTLAAANAVHGQGPPDLDYAEHRVTLSLDPEAGTLSGRDSATVYGIGVITLALVEGWRLTDLGVDDRPVSPVPLGDGRWLVPRFLHGGHTLEATFEGSGEAAGIRLAADGSHFPAGAPWYPRPPARDRRLDVTLQLPPGQRGLVTGHPLEESDTGDAFEARFRVDAPRRAAVVAGPYTITEQHHGGWRLRTYFPDDLARAHADDYLGHTARYLHHFSQLIGHQRRDTFSVVAAPLPIGISLPGFTYISAAILHRPFVKERALAHEIAHAWWGNGVYRDPAGGDWTEGLTTLLADHDITASGDPDAARAMRLEWLQAYAALPPVRDQALGGLQRPAAGGAHRVIGYNKSAMVFLTLRRHIGPSAFEAGLRRFWLDHRGREAGWPELQNAFATAHGRPLDRFFEQWLEQPGAPKLALDAVRCDRVAGGYRITGNLGPAEQPYRLQVPVRITTDTGPEDRTVTVDGADPRIRVITRTAPRSIELDPDYEVFRRLTRGEAVPQLRAVALDPATSVVLADPEGSRAREAARRIAGALVPAGDRDAGDAPRLVAGTDAAVSRAMAALDLARPPDAVAGRGSAYAWAQRDDNGRVTVIVTARDADGLEAILPRIRRYTRHGYVAFDGGEVEVTGSPEPDRGAVAARFDGAAACDDQP